MTTLHLELSPHGYDITVGAGVLHSAAEYFKLDRKVLIVTDTGVPREYAECVLSQCREGRILTVPEGEGSKSTRGLESVLSAMCEMNMTRGDCAVAVGGGVVGDLTGFAAASYMRGIDFYNVPSTVLSQVDSSIGGKTAINFMGIKNIVGAFYQPRAVLIDTELLSTLPKRQISNGLAEAVKMSLTSDAALFEKFESLSFSEILKNIEEVIISSLKIKRGVVELDEREGGLRKILNFGHTLGHGIEAEEEMRGMYHGECVALGMIPMCAPEVAKRLVAVLDKLGLPTGYCGNLDGALAFVTHDKKCHGGKVSAIRVPEVGKFEISYMTADEFAETVKNSILCK